jgi:hypothetical protein
MYLGIDNHAGLVYEGLGIPDIPVVPTPNLTQAKLIESEDDWLHLPNELHDSWIFREDSFDAVTRTRRGRLYAPQSGQGQPSHQWVSAHPYEDPLGRQFGANGKIGKHLYTYTACSELLTRPNKGQGCTIALGTPQAASIWRIIQTENLASKCVLITIKALSAFGMVPEVDISKIAPEFKVVVTQAMDRVLNSAFRETPISVIDHCRNAMAVLISRWLVQIKDHDQKILKTDLGQIATILQNKSLELGFLANLASLVARLHTRGKDNEQHKYGTRTPVDEDAQFAIEALGITIREIKWARM